jgi:chromosome segregation ATPase
MIAANELVARDDRVRAVLTAAVTSEEAAAVLAETTAAAVALDGAIAAVRQRALDPAAAAAAASEARAERDRLNFDRERVGAQLDALKRRLDDLREAEDLASAGVEYQAAKVDRDQLIIRLKDRYPAIVAELVELFEALDANDARLARVNGKLDGREWLLEAEPLARGFDGPGHKLFAPLRSSKLIDFGLSNQPWAWPGPVKVARTMAELGSLRG